MARKEHRQRGKKRKSERKPDELSAAVDNGSDPLPFVEDRVGELSVPEQNGLATTSWLLEKRTATDDVSTPFGLVESDLKAYLRSAQVTLKELVEAAVEQERKPFEDDDVKALRNAMLDEIKSNELVLATDSDTSIVLEDLLTTFGPRQTRIMASALSQECVTLVCHRFGSHVVQSILPLLQYFTIVSMQSSSREEEDGSALESGEQIILNISEALRERVLDVVRNPFASHVLRTVLLVLSGRVSWTDATRSKRSKKFQSQKTQSSSASEKPWSSLTEANMPAPPVSFKLAKNALLKTLKEELYKIDGREQIRAMCVDPISGPTLALIVELDAADNEKNATPHTSNRGQVDLLDICLDGLVAKEVIDERSAHVETLLRDSVGSHVLETILKASAPQVVHRFWASYVKRRFVKLGTHPTANFVVATLLRRLDDDAFDEACEEIEADGKTLIESRHLGVLIAVVDRGRQLTEARVQGNSSGPAKKGSVWTKKDKDCLAVRAVLRAFGIQDAEEEANENEAKKADLVRLMLSGKTTSERKKDLKKQKKAKKYEKVKRKQKRSKGDDNGDDEEGVNNGDNVEAERGVDSVTLQGSLLCQSIVRLSEPANAPLLDSILASDDLLPIATHASSVHVLLAALESPRLAFSQRSRLSGKVLEQIEPLLDDKFGSRLCDSTFDTSDLFFREKMAKKCLSLERQLLGSTYGRFFILRRVQLGLYRRDLARWREAMRAQKQQRQEELAKAETAEAAQDRNVADAPSQPDEESGKRKKQKRNKVDEELDTILAGI